MAYFTYMGGDMKITEVYTSTPGQRHLLVIKDSYGNALPSFLFGSFSEVHVVDFRYFHRNLLHYIEEHRITDLLFCFNTFNVSSGHVARRCLSLLSQKDGSFHLRPDSILRHQATIPDTLIKVKTDSSLEMSGHDEAMPIASPDTTGIGETL